VPTSTRTLLMHRSFPAARCAAAPSSPSVMSPSTIWSFGPECDRQRGKESTSPVEPGPRGTT